MGGMEDAGVVSGKLALIAISVPVANSANGEAGVVSVVDPA
jgi:hypothetical protein